MKDRFEAVYREALEAGKVDPSQIVRRANSLVQAYNGALQYAVQAGATQLGVEELTEISGKMEDPKNIRLGVQRVAQVSANIDKAMIALGFPIHQELHSEK